MLIKSMNIIVNYGNNTLRGVIMNNLEDKPILRCIHCSYEKIVKYGKLKNRQRYLCKSCKRTFTSYTNKPWSYSKKPLKMWKEYIAIMKNHCLLEISKILKFNIASAFSWRHKLMNYWKNNKSQTLKNYVAIQNRPIKENRKGTRIPYIKCSNLTLTIALDSNTNTLLGTHYKIITLKILEHFIVKNIKSTSIILDSTNRYVNLIKNRFNTKRNLKDKQLININGYFYSFLKWIGMTFRGVATKNLQYYIAWFNF